MTDTDRHRQTDRQTDRQTHGHSIYRESRARAVKILWFCNYTFLMNLFRLFKCTNIDVINDCRRFFQFELPSEVFGEKSHQLSLWENLRVVKTCIDILTSVYKSSWLLFFSLVCYSSYSFLSRLYICVFFCVFLLHVANKDYRRLKRVIQFTKFPVSLHFYRPTVCYISAESK